MNFSLITSIAKHNLNLEHWNKHLQAKNRKNCNFNGQQVKPL